MLVAKQSEVDCLRTRRGARRKRSSTDDVFTKLYRLVHEPAERDSTSAASTTATPSASTQMEAEDCKGALKNIFHCSVCMNTSSLPAAVCVNCSSVMGCVPCIEQWIEASTSKCPLCRTTQHYALMPMVRGLAEILGQPLPANPAHGGRDSDADSEDTVAYEENDFSEFPSMLG